MPRERKITRVVDALAGQDRIILWLDCPHKISVGRAALEQLGHYEGLYQVGHTLLCPHCPDPPPEDVRRSKTAQQLYREAGEP